MSSPIKFNVDQTSSRSSTTTSADFNNPSTRFQINSIIGDTLQGRIYQGIDKITNKFVAIKETWKILVQLNQCRQGTKIRENYWNEVNILNYLSSDVQCPPSIIRILSTWEEKDCFMYAMEYCDYCLFNYMKKIHEKGHMKLYCDTMKKLPQRTMNYRESLKNPFLHYVQKIFIKLTHAVSYLHSKRIVHLDLSLENIMLTNINNSNHNHIHNPSIKIIDFGLARYCENGQDFILSERCGKSSYMAPEVYSADKFADARKADIWSLGICLFVMLIGTHLINKPCLMDDRYCYLMKKGGIKPLLKNWRRLRLINDDVLDLMQRIFQYESKRIDMEQILKHPFLDPNRYSVHDQNNESQSINDDDHEMDIEPTPTPSSVGTASIYSADDIDYGCVHDVDDDQKSGDEHPIIGGFDDDDQDEQMNDKQVNDNDNDEQQRTLNQIPARVESKKSVIEPDDFINPRIGRDGLFEFGIIGNNDNDDDNHNGNKQQKYAF